jgi:hypothetical protein
VSADPGPEGETGANCKSDDDDDSDAAPDSEPIDPAVERALAVFKKPFKSFSQLKPNQLNHETTITAAQLNPRLRVPQCKTQLMPTKQNLGFKSASDLTRSATTIPKA